MGEIRDCDWRALLAGVGELYAARDLDELARAAIRTVNRLAPNDCTAYTEISAAEGRAVSRYDSADAERACEAVRGAFERHMHEHPLLAHFARDPRAGTMRISDVVDGRTYRRLALYQEAYRHLEGEHQVVVPVSTGAVAIGVALNRRLSDFTDVEREMLELLRPHVARAYRAVVARQRARDVIEGRDPARSRDVLRRVLGVTPREAEVLVWVLQGKTNPEVAVILGCSARTVDKHLENTFRKLGVSSRTGAVLAVVERLG